MAARRLPSNSRKLLVAALGVAAVNYIACSSSFDHPTSGNLMSLPPDEAGVDGQFPTSGNLMAPDAQVHDAAADDADAGATDASDDADAADASQ